MHRRFIEPSGRFAVCLPRYSSQPERRKEDVYLIESFVEIEEYEELGSGLSSFIVTVETPNGTIPYYQSVFLDRAREMARQAAFRFAGLRIVDKVAMRSD